MRKPGEIYTKGAEKLWWWYCLGIVLVALIFAFLFANIFTFFSPQGRKALARFLEDAKKD